jgi:hypothetical protein
MFILLIDVDDDTRSVVFNDLSLHDKGERKLKLLTMFLSQPRLDCSVFLYG